jgi:hypothetical protein
MPEAERRRQGAAEVLVELVVAAVVERLLALRTFHRTLHSAEPIRHSVGI